LPFSPVFRHILGHPSGRLWVHPFFDTFQCWHIESSRPSELLNQDAFYWGTLKGVGKVYVQVVVDGYCSLAFIKFYNSKMPITACDLLYDRVLPFYELLGVPV